MPVVRAPAVLRVPPFPDLSAAAASTWVRSWASRIRIASWRRSSRAKSTVVTPLPPPPTCSRYTPVTHTSLPCKARTAHVQCSYEAFTRINKLWTYPDHAMGQCLGWLVVACTCRWEGWQWVLHYPGVACKLYIPVEAMVLQHTYKMGIGNFTRSLSSRNFLDTFHCWSRDFTRSKETNSLHCCSLLSSATGEFERIVCIEVAIYAQKIHGANIHGPAVAVLL